MIPYFPEFKPIEWIDKLEVEKFTSKFQPYADFNFTSLWSWDFNNSYLLSQLNKNLVIVFTDYITNNYFLSFIGDTESTETAQLLIKWSKENYNVSCLKLIPESSIVNLNLKKISASIDEDSNDYILSIPYLATMNAQKKNRIAQIIRRFNKEYPNCELKENSITEINKKKYLNLFEQWAISSNISDLNTLNEFRAFERHLQIPNDNIKVLSLYIDDSLVVFDTFEIVSTDYVTIHFGKTNNLYKGVFPAFQWMEGQYFLEKGLKYLNIQQDLGLPGLRFSKQKFKPCFFLNKYTINQVNQ